MAFEGIHKRKVLSGEGLTALMLCLQRQLVLLSLFDANCAQIINTSAGDSPLHFVMQPCHQSYCCPCFLFRSLIKGFLACFTRQT